MTVLVNINIYRFEYDYKLKAIHKKNFFMVNFNLLVNL